MAGYEAPAAAKAPAAATIAAAATWPDFSDGNLGPDSTDDNLGPDSTDGNLGVALTSQNIIFGPWGALGPCCGMALQGLLLWFRVRNVGLACRTPAFHVLHAWRVFCRSQA